jgi:large subunit ribosomal protein L17
MRHRQAGRHLGRDTAHRKALYRNLVTDLLRYERVTTTEAKAKEIRPMAERIITLGKRGDLHARRQALRFLYDKHVVEHVFDEIAPRMATRPGGYLRITALEPRKGDGSRMATIELVDFNAPAAPPAPAVATSAPARRARAAVPAPADEPPPEDVIDATAGSPAATAAEPVIGADTAADAAVDTTEEPTAEVDDTAEASDEPADDEEEGKDGAS